MDEDWGRAGKDRGQSRKRSGAEPERKSSRAPHEDLAACCHCNAVLIATPNIRHARTLKAFVLLQHRWGRLLLQAMTDRNNIRPALIVTLGSLSYLQCCASLLLPLICLGSRFAIPYTILGPGRPILQYPYLCAITYLCALRCARSKACHRLGVRRSHM